MTKKITPLLLMLVFLTNSVAASFAAGRQFGDQYTKAVVGKRCIGRSGLTGVWVVVCADRKPPVKPGTCAQTTVVCRVLSYGPAPTPKTHN
jgi:hypothetical protein